MRLLTFRENGSTQAGRLEGDEVVELDYADVGAILDADELGRARMATGPTRPLEGLRLAPPVLRPPKIVCIGQNYLAHIQEQNAKVPEYPTIFPKWPRTLVGPTDEVMLPAISDRSDWEVELAFYVGRELRHASEEEALAAIAGYTILNDVSIRDWQHRTTQWLPGKNFERTTPVGPWLVTPDELDPLNLTVRCTVAGKVMQESNTSDFLFKPAEVAAYVSTFTTLEPGDLFATGTPSGVGDFRKPPIYLRDGQEMRTEIEGIGELVNRCVKER